MELEAAVVVALVALVVLVVVLVVLIGVLLVVVAVLLVVVVVLVVVVLVVVVLVVVLLAPHHHGTAIRQGEPSRSRQGLPSQRGQSQRGHFVLRLDDILLLAQYCRTVLVHSQGMAVVYFLVEMSVFESALLESALHLGPAWCCDRVRPFLLLLLLKG